MICCLTTSETLLLRASRYERCDKEHWRDEAKRLGQLLAGRETELAIINVPQPKTAHEAVQALALAPTVEPEQKNSPNSEMVLATHSAPSAPHQWWERLRSSGKALLAQATRLASSRASPAKAGS